MNTHYKNYYSIQSAIPKQWQQILKTTITDNKNFMIARNQIFNILCGQNCVKKIYKELLTKITSPLIKSQWKWKTNLSQEGIDWYNL